MKLLDFGKSIKNLLEDDFFYHQKLKISTINDSNIEVVGEGELSLKGVNSSLSIKHINSGISIDKIRVKSDGRLLLEASVKTSLNSKIFIAAEDGRQEPGKPLQSFGKLGCDIELPNIFASVDVDVVNGPLLRTSAIYNWTNSLKFGGEAVLNTHFEEKDKNPQFTEAFVATAYTGKGYVANLQLCDTFSTVKVSYLHDVSPLLSVGTQVEYKLKTNSQKFIIGTKYLFDPNGDSLIKTKIDSSSLLSASFQHKLSNSIKMTVNAEVDMQGLDNHKFGFGLDFSP